MLRVARRQPAAFLLAVQLTGVLLYPLMEDDDAGRALFGAFNIVVLGFVVLTVKRSPATTWIAVLLGAPAIVLRVIEAATGSDQLLPYSAAVETLLYFYAAGALIAYMLADHEVTPNELVAAGATFTLLASGFASVYLVCQSIEPGSFNAAVAPTQPRTWIELLLLSFATLSNVGIGDVVPVKPFARSLVMLEQIAGVGYIAVVVSRLVALSIRRRPRPEP